MAAEIQRNEYNSLKKIVEQTHTSSLVKPRNDRMEEVKTTCQKVEKMELPHLVGVFQKLNEEPSISNKLPMKLDVSIKFVPKLPKTKNSDPFQLTKMRSKLSMIRKVQFERT